MKPPFPSATPTWHNDTYDAISPKRSELSVVGKTVVVTGAGSGIGRASALAFAEAGAANVVLIGRREETLKETQELLPKQTKSSMHAVSVSDGSGLQRVAADIGPWDVLVLNAGYIAKPSPIASADVDEWWQCFETNTKGTLSAVQAFLPTANPAHAAVLGVTTGTASVPASQVPGISSYIASKLAAVKVLEYLAAEHEHIFVASIHPGMVETDMFRKAGARAEDWPMDKVELPAHFMVWLASPEAAFLKGRVVWANWDVEELKAQESSITSGLDMTSGILGWPYPHMN